MVTASLDPPHGGLQGLLKLNQTTGHWYSVALIEKTLTVRSEPFDELRTGYAAPAAKSKSKPGASSVAFDFATLRSGRTEMGSTASEEVYESRAIRFSCITATKRRKSNGSVWCF